MTSLVVHFCSAPLAQHPIALDTPALPVIPAGVPAWRDERSPALGTLDRRGPVSDWRFCGTLSRPEGVADRFTPLNWIQGRGESENPGPSQRRRASRQVSNAGLREAGGE